MECRKLGAAASRVHVEVVRAAGWEWLRAGTGSGRGVVLRLEGLQAGVPQNLGDTQDIHHHLGAMDPVGAGVGASGCASADGGAASR